MREILFEIFGFKVYSYSAMLVIGVLFLALSFVYNTRCQKIQEKTIDRLFIIGAIAGVFTYLGSSFFDSLWHSIGDAMIDGKFNASIFKLDLTNGGITFEGGIITGMIAFLVLITFGLKRDKNHQLFFADNLIVGILFAHCLGRIGCFLSGCCYGKHTDSIFGVSYPVDFDYIENEPIYDTVFPTQLYESAFLLILCVVFILFVKKYKTEIYFASYGIFRFNLEFLRGDDRGGFIIPFLSPSQFMSIVMVIMAVIFFLIRLDYEKKQKAYILSLDKSSMTQEELNEEKAIVYFKVNPIKLLPGLFNKHICPDCNKKCKVKKHIDVKDINEYQLMSKVHYVYSCNDCKKEYEIK